MARTLQAGDIARDRDVTLLHAAGQSLLATASNVLDVSAIESKALRVENELFDLAKYEIAHLPFHLNILLYLVCWKDYRKPHKLHV